MGIITEISELVQQMQPERCPYLPQGANPGQECSLCDGSGNLTDGVDYIGECPHYTTAKTEERVRRYWDKLPSSMKAALRNMTEQFAWGQSMTWQPTEYSRALVLAGQVGTGKTMAMHRHVIQLMRRLMMPVHCVTAIRIEDDVTSMVHDEDAAARLRYTLRRCQDEGYIVAIDDLGRERTSPAVMERLSTMLFELHSRRAPMVLTTNLSIDAIAARYGEHIGDRLLDTEWTTIVACNMATGRSKPPSNQQSAGRAKIRPATAILA